MFPFNRVAKVRKSPKFAPGNHTIKVLVIAESGEQFTDWATDSIGGPSLKVSFHNLLADCGRIQYKCFKQHEDFNSDKWRGYVFNSVIFLGQSKLSHENACIIQSCLRE